MGQTQEATKPASNPHQAWLRLLDLDGEGSVGSELNNLKAFVYLFGQWYYMGGKPEDEEDRKILSQSIWLWEHLTEDLEKAIHRAVDHNRKATQEDA